MTPGIHKATLAEVEDTFVVGAPFEAERRAIFSAFTIWHAKIMTVIPDAIFWVDGGFVTHKATAPGDMDIVIRTRPDTLNALSPQGQALLETLVTQGETPTSPRLQPMAGKIDAFIALRTQPDRTKYWRDLWSHVKLGGVIIPGEEKGFVEVSGYGI